MLNKEALGLLRIFGLIVFNVGMGFIGLNIKTWLWMIIAIVGNILIIFLTKEKGK